MTGAKTMRLRSTKTVPYFPSSMQPVPQPSKDPPDGTTKQKRHDNQGQRLEEGEAGDRKGVGEHVHPENEIQDWLGNCK